MKRKYIALLVILSATFLYGCTGKITDSLQNKPNIEPTPTVIETKDPETENDTKTTETEVIKIKVTSESLTSEGKWLTTINSKKGNPAGSNQSPQLSWDKVEGANCYAIYMVDNSASYWLHWMAKNVNDNNLTLGAELDESRYEGPYPPSGIHEYEVIVYALKGAPDKYPGVFNSSNSSLEAMEEKLDTIDGVSGNIIGKGSIIGTVTVGEAVE